MTASFFIFLSHDCLFLKNHLPLPLIIKTDTIMPKYLDPKADLTFKKIFGQHKHLVMSLLNALLPLPDGMVIKSVEYLTPENIPDTPAKNIPLLMYIALTITAENLSLKCSRIGTRNFLPVHFLMQQLFTPSN